MDRDCQCEMVDKAYAESELGADYGGSGEEDDFPLAQNIMRGRGRTPNRKPSLELVPTPARATGPPSGEFDPLELDIPRAELSEELAGRERFERLPRLHLREIATLYPTRIFHRQ